MIKITISDEKGIAIVYSEDEIKNLPESQLYKKAIYVHNDKENCPISNPWYLAPNEGENCTFTLKMYKYAQTFKSIKDCLLFYIDTIKKYKYRIIVYVNYKEENDSYILWIHKGENSFIDLNTRYTSHYLSTIITNNPWSKVAFLGNPEHPLWDLKGDIQKENIKGYIITDEDNNVLLYHRSLCRYICDLENSNITLENKGTGIVKAILFNRLQVIGQINFDEIHNYLDINDN